MISRLKRAFFAPNLPSSHRLFWTLFTPIFLISLVFSVVFFSYRVNDLETKAEEKIADLSAQLAINSAYAIQLSDTKLLYQLLESSLNLGDISNITIFNRHKEVISDIGPSTILSTPLLPPTNYSTKTGSYLVNTQPIFQNSSSIDRSLGQPSERINRHARRDIIGWVKIESSTSQLDIAKYQLFFLLFFLFTLSNAFIALLAWRTATAFSQPIDKLSWALKKLTKSQYPSAKSIKLPQQYSEIQKDLLEIIERLENHKDEFNAGIEQATEDMRRNMDSMEEKSAQLYIANKEVMESSRLKSQFLANISHEVRTPLNAILGYTKILNKNIKDNQNKLYVETIEQSTNNLLAIIGDILDFSKIEAGKLSLDKRQVNIRALVDDVYQTLSANLLTSDKQVDLVTEFSPDVPQLMIGDTIRIRQVLTNLISNALKFTHKGSIKTKAILSNQSNNSLTLSFQVIDTGIGIAEDKINKLFKPFSQVDTSTTRKFGGTGLGLVITKKLVEQMGGGIGISSTPNVGSTFYFTLKLQMYNKPQPAQERLEKRIIFLEPSSIYRNHLSNYFRDIGVESIACSGVEQVISSLNKAPDDIDAILINVIPNKQSTDEAQELALYAINQHNTPCLLMIQPPGQINHYPSLKAVCNEVLLKPISHKHLFNALKNIQPPNTLTTLESNKEQNTPEPEPISPSKFTGLKILAVDDTQINLQLLNHWLSPHGIDISLAYSGHKALELAKETTFDLVLMDIQMPEMDGLETTQALRTLSPYKDVPIIALTAHALGSEQDNILAAGMNAYLTKPVDETILLHTIETWCFKKDSIQEHNNKQVSKAFDLDKALSIVDQKETIAKEMFDMLADSLPNEKKLLHHHFENQDIDKMIQVVHRIHGASKYTGTIELTRHAGFLETHLKELGSEDVEGVLEDFIDSIDTLMSIRGLIPWSRG